MNMRDLVFPFLLALLGTWGLQYFFFWGEREKRAEVLTDRSFTAPTSVQVAEPLDLDIDFYDAKPTRPKEITQVELPYGTIHFSNDGAVIDFIGYKRMLGGKEGVIETVVPSQSKEKGAFLVALNGLGNTPYYYDLIEKKEETDRTYVAYKGESANAVVTKEFFVYHDTYAIDLKVTVEPKGDVSLRPRLFFPAPLTDEEGTVQAVLYTSSGSIEKKQIKTLADFGKNSPSVFGLEDRYFMNALFADPQGFAQRAYFKTEGDNVQTVLQSPSVQKKTTWELSFYAGPKELGSLSKVSEKLEGVLDYGWFAPLSKLLLYALNFFYGILKNYGLAIIAITFLARLLMFPFTLHGDAHRRRSMEAQRKLQYIEQKYKNNPELLARERAEYTRKHVLPGMLGCLPLLLQIPVFIGLQRVLANAIELYRAPFLWIPDLSAADPYYILPALVAIGMVFQLAGNDPRQRVANILIAIIVAAFMANLSAGLTLFICVSTLLGLAQTGLQKALKI